MDLPPNVSPLSGFFQSVRPKLSRQDQIECLRLTFLCKQDTAESWLRHAPARPPDSALRSFLVHDDEIVRLHVDDGITEHVADASSSSRKVARTTLADSMSAYNEGFLQGASRMKDAVQTTLDAYATIHACVSLSLFLSLFFVFFSSLSLSLSHSLHLY